MADGDGTIEAALEVTRNLHRLIISVSVITFVFALSLRQPQNEKSQQDAIEHFLNFDFSRYDTYVEEKIAESGRRLLKQPVEDLRAAVEKAKAPVFGTPQIAAAFDKPTVVGRFKVSDTKLVTPGDLTLRQLDVLKTFPLSEDVRIFVPEVQDIAPIIQDFLEKSGRPGMNVQTVRVAASEDFPDTELPAAGTMVKMTCHFELIGQSPPFPVFQAVLNATVEAVPETSFLAWLSKQPGAAEITSNTIGGLTWLPTLQGLPKDQAERRLGDVLASLKASLEKGRPESQTVSLLGAEIPGSLLIFATPLTLLALCYYLLFHLVHLSHYAVEHAIIVRRFAWLPLTLQAGWVWETGFSIGLLPMAALLTLGGQLFRFGFLTVTSALFIAIVTLGVGWLVKKSFRQVSSIRSQITPAVKPTAIKEARMTTAVKPPVSKGPPTSPEPDREGEAGRQRERRDGS